MEIITTNYNYKYNLNIKILIQINIINSNKYDNYKNNINSLET